MIRAVLVAVRAALSAVTASAVGELVGAGLIVAAAWRHWGMDAGLAALGIALLLKAAEADLAGGEDRRT